MKDKTTLISVIGVIILAIAIAVVERKDPDLSPNEQRYDASLVINSQTVNNDLATTNSTNMSERNSGGTENPVFKDYTVTVNYGIPQGYSENMTVTLRLLSNVITDATVQYDAGANHESAWYQNRFQSAYKPLVIGKNIDSISLSRVGGASLTTNAFNAALQAIKEQVV